MWRLDFIQPLKNPDQSHSPEDFLVWLVGVLVIGHDARLEVFVSSSIPRVLLGIASAREQSPIAQLISTGVIGIPLCPGHHQKAQTAAQRQPQNKRQRRPEHGQNRGKTHSSARRGQLWKECPSFSSLAQLNTCEPEEKLMCGETGLLTRREKCLKSHVVSMSLVPDIVVIKCIINLLQLFFLGGKRYLVKLCKRKTLCLIFDFIFEDAQVEKRAGKTCCFCKNEIIANSFTLFTFIAV